MPQTEELQTAEQDVYSTLEAAMATSEVAHSKDHGSSYPTDITLLSCFCSFIFVFFEVHRMRRTRWAVTTRVPLPLPQNNNVTWLKVSRKICMCSFFSVYWGGHSMTQVQGGEPGEMKQCTRVQCIMIFSAPIPSTEPSSLLKQKVVWMEIFR